MPDDAVFCPECGTSLQAEPVNETPAETPAETPVETPAAEGPIAVAPAPAVATAVPTEPKPGKKAPIALFAVLAVVAAAVVLVVCFYAQFTNLVKKTFMSSEKYYQSVEQENAKDLTERLTKAYDSLVVENIQSDSKNVNAEFEFALGEKGKSLLSAASALTTVKVDWIDSFGFKVDGNRKDNAGDVALDLFLNGTEIVKTDFAADLEQYILYIGVPTITSKYLALNVPALGGFDVEELAKQLNDYSSKMQEVIPTEKEIGTLFERYRSIVIKNSNNVEKKNGVVINADGVEQKVTELIVTYDEETVKAICEKMAETVAEDKELKEVLTRIAALANEEGQDLDVNEMIDELVKGLKDATTEMGSDFPDMKMSVYVDNKGHIVGRVSRITVGDKSADIAMYTAKNGGEYGFAATVTVDGAVMGEFSGSGKLSGDKFSGDYSLEISGATIVTGEIEKFDLLSAKNGYLNGYFSVKVGSGVMTAANLAGINSSVSSATLGILQNYSLGFDFDCSKNKEKVVISVANDKDTIFTITSSLSQGSAKSFSLPGESDVVDIDDVNSYMDYVGSLNFDEFLSNLKKAGVPSEYIDLIDAQLDRFDY